MGTCGHLTHDGITPELGHLPGSHGAEQRLPDLQLEHLAHDDLHGDASFPAVIDHCPLKVILQCLEVEGDLARRKLNVEPGLTLQREPSVPLPALNPSAMGPSLLPVRCWFDWQLSIRSRRLCLLPTYLRQQADGGVS